jgi:hypothetical protein
LTPARASCSASRRIGNLQIGVVARREFDALRGNQIDEWFVQRRQVLVYRRHDLFVALRAGDLEHLRMAIEDSLRLRAQAAGDDDLAILGQRLADRLQGFVHRRIDEAAGIHHHEVGRAIARRHFIALGAQAREDALRVDQGLRASQADETDFGRARADGFTGFGGAMGGEFHDEWRPWRVILAAHPGLSGRVGPGGERGKCGAIVLQKPDSPPIQARCAGFAAGWVARPKARHAAWFALRAALSNAAARCPGESVTVLAEAGSLPRVSTQESREGSDKPFECGHRSARLAGEVNTRERGP